MGWHSTHSLQEMGTQGAVKARPAGVPDMQQAGTADPRGETYPLDGGRKSRCLLWQMFILKIPCFKARIMTLAVPTSPDLCRD